MLKFNEDEIKDLLIDGIFTDGGHHKQWFLEQIFIKMFGLKEFNENIGETEGSPP